MAVETNGVGLHPIDALIKRLFDFLFSATGLLLCFWVIGITWVLASIDTGANGFFLQRRVGRNGRIFKAIKLRTMNSQCDVLTTVTTSSDRRITKLGSFWRKLKIDELPQLFNVLVGQMSFVGPRPDVPGFADLLEGEDRIILSVRPGITGPATIKYRNEEQILASVKNPEEYNREVIFPDKVKINKEYIQSWSFWQDVRYIVATVVGK